MKTWDWREKGLMISKVSKIKVIVVAAFCCCFVISGTVMASEKYFQKDTPLLTEKTLLDIVQKSSADIDTYSRNLYEDERERFEKLQNEYLSEGILPQNELPIVENVQMIKEGMFAFAIEESMFFFPEERLSDEEILEVIDFCYKRDQSLQESHVDESLEVYEFCENEKNDAIDKSLLYIDYFYGVDAKNYEISIELDLNNAYRLQFSSDDCGAYVFLYDLTEKKITEMEYCPNTEEVADNIEIDNEMFAEKGVQILEDINAINNYGDITEVYCDYNTRDKIGLERNLVSYIFKLNDGNCYVAKYNFALEKTTNLFVVPYENYQKTIENNVEKLRKRGIYRERINISF